MRWLSSTAFVFFGCASFLNVPLEDLSEKATVEIAKGDFVEGKIIRRFADGRLLVRTVKGIVWSIDPKRTCSWCWVYLSRKVFVEIQNGSAILVNPLGDRIECWNGGQVGGY